MKINELRALRADAVKEAQAIMDKADAEKRELTPDEIKQIDGLIGVDDGSVPNKVSTIDAQIKVAARVSGMVADLEKTADDQHDPVKPSGVKPKMKRADWEKLSPSSQAAYIQGGGKLED